MLLSDEPTDEEPAPFRRIATDLRRRISTGDLPVGSPVPSERELAATYEVARNTARAALDVLRKEGWAKIEHGKRTVATTPSMATFVAGLDNEDLDELAAAVQDEITRRRH